MGKTIYGEPFVTDEVRLQFCNLKDPDTKGKFSSGKYGVRALIKKKRKEYMQKLMDVVADVYPGDNLEELEKHPLLNKRGKLRDGDDPKVVKYEGHTGHFFFNAGSENQPDTYVIDDSGEPQPCDPSEIYNGCYAQLALQPAYLEEYDTVTFFLQGVMKTRDGERFSSGRTDTKSLLANWGKGGADKKASTTKKGAVEDEDVEDEDTEEEETEQEKPVKGKRGRPAKKKVEEPEEEDEDEEEEKSPPKKKSKTFDRDQADDEDEDSSGDDDEEDEKPAKKKTLNKKKKGQGMSSLLDADDEDDDE